MDDIGALIRVPRGKCCEYLAQFRQNSTLYTTPVSGFIYEPRNRFLGSYMSPETGVEFQNESHVKFTVCDLLHVLINLLMLELVFCVYLYHCKPVDLMVVRYMFIPNQIP